MTQPIRATPEGAARSPFLGHRVHELAGLDLAPGGHAPRFDDDVWDLGGLAGAPVQLWAATLVFDFTTIRHLPWRWVARELMIGLLAPGDDRVAVLPLAYRDALAPHTCRGRLLVLTGWLNWLTEQGVTSLGQVTQHHCDRYLHHHRSRGLHASSLMAVALAVKDLARYGPLLTVDRYNPAFVPWFGQTPTAVAGYQRAGENVTPPVPEEILRPALHAGLYLVETIGPHLAGAAAALRERRRQPRWKRRPQREEMLAYFNQHIHTGQPLPEIDSHRARERVTSGWDRDDPLLRVSFGPMAHQLRCAPPSLRQLDDIREAAENAVRRVGVAPPLVRDAEAVARADGSGGLAWTQPLTAVQLDDLVAVVLDACLLVTAAISGMRSGELMEITPGSCLPPRQIGDGLFRFELLLAKRAVTLHVQAANYCWFTDPVKALCLKLAGTPQARVPLAGLCDAARCPQATFHPQHRAVWANYAQTTTTFLGNPRIPAGEKTRLAGEHHRAQQVIQAIDAANPAHHSKETLA
jgi:hypothetical protein